LAEEYLCIRLINLTKRIDNSPGLPTGIRGGGGVIGNGKVNLGPFAISETFQISLIPAKGCGATGIPIGNELELQYHSST
jgi:hypothetical protein